jgi:hypothetical protein
LTLDKASVGGGFDIGLPYVVLLLPNLQADKLSLSLALFVAFTQFMLRLLTGGLAAMRRSRSAARP